MYSIISCYLFSLFYYFSKFFNFQFNFFLKNAYSYENIKLCTAKPLDENEVTRTLKDVYSRIKKSSLYNANANYRVCLANSRSCELLYFKLREVKFKIGDIINEIKVNKKIDSSTIELGDRIAGYVKATAVSWRSEDVLHDDGNYYRHHYESVVWSSDYYFNEYSQENMLIIKELLSECDILKLLKKFNNKKNIEKATYNYFLSRGFHKVEDAGVLEGKWFRCSCDYKHNPCTLYSNDN